MAEQIKYRILDTIRKTNFYFSSLKDYILCENHMYQEEKTIRPRGFEVYKTQKVEVFKLLQNTQIPVFYVYVNGKFEPITYRDIEDFRTRDVLEVMIATTNEIYPNFVKRLTKEQVDEILNGK